MAMRLNYDRTSDAATIYLIDEIRAGDAPRSVMCDLEVQNGAVILLLTVEGRLVGIEVLGASRVLPAEVLAAASAPEPPP
jgi:uncharacterized protein YuzE